MPGADERLVISFELMYHSPLVESEECVSRRHSFGSDGGFWGSESIAGGFRSDATSNEQQAVSCSSRARVATISRDMLLQSCSCWQAKGKLIESGSKGVRQTLNIARDATPSDSRADQLHHSACAISLMVARNALTPTNGFVGLERSTSSNTTQHPET
jgi:hypothetical protein